MTTNVMIAWEFAWRQCQSVLHDLKWKCRRDSEDPIDREAVADRIDNALLCGDDLLQAIRDYLEDETEGVVNGVEAVQGDRGGETPQLAPESAAVAPNVVGDFVIGAHSDLNGRDATLVTGFEPTRAELITVGLHHLHRYYMELINGAYGYSGSQEWRVISFSKGRFDRINTALGGDVTEFVEAISRYDRQLRRAEQEAAQMLQSQRGDTGATTITAEEAIPPTEESVEDFIRRMDEMLDDGNEPNGE